jgi:energy-coupling factor transport system ATP-binding protein
MAFIELRDLTYAYPITEKPALRNLSLELEEGQFLAVIGPNGAGKSTLCFTIAGFVPHFYKGKLEGQVRVGGLDTQHATLNDFVQKVGLVFQNPFNQISGSKFTVFEEIAFGLENRGMTREEMKPRIDRIMEATRIQDLRDRSPYALSGGQQQRVALASILVLQPSILVLDEPTSQLDPVGTREVFQVIKDMSQQGMTIILAEHKIEWVAEFADRVIALADGEIIFEGSPAEVLASPALTEHGVGVSRYTTAARQALDENLWPLGRPLPVRLDEAITGFREILS